jgi:hypothetical protein
MEIAERIQVDLKQYKALFVVVTVVLALLVASPALQRILVYPRTEFFTEFSMLGSEHMAENYPHNITNGENYRVFLGVSNKLGSCSYYRIEVKFRNQTQSAPNSFSGIPSSLPSLYGLNVFVADKESLEIPVSFSFNYSFRDVARTVYTNVTVPGEPGQNATIERRADNVTLLQANFDNLNFNGETLNMRGTTSDWNSQTNLFYGNLIFELWIYNNTFGSFQYDQRFMDLKLNMTSIEKGSTFVG